MLNWFNIGVPILWTRSVNIKVSCFFTGIFSIGFFVYKAAAAEVYEAHSGETEGGLQQDVLLLQVPMEDVDGVHFDGGVH